MNSLLYLTCLQLAVLEVYSQCANRVVQGPNGPIELLPNQVLLPPGMQFVPGVQPQGRPLVLPNQNPPCNAPAQPIIVPASNLPAEYITNFGPVLTSFASALPNVLSGNVISNVASGVPNVLSGNMVSNLPSVLPDAYAPTVIHDSSVANSLANALQLLVVSNLLSNTLPAPYDPPFFDSYNWQMPGYNYIY